MHKYYKFFVVFLLIVFTPLHTVNSQEATRYNLPDGAIERFGKGWVRDIEFSPNGEKFAVATTIGILIYDSRTGQEKILIEDSMSSGAEALSYSPTGNILAVAHEDYTIRLWNPNFQNQQKPIPTLRGHTDRILAIRFSPDGKILASASADSSIRLWNPYGLTDEDKLIAILPYKAPVRAIAFSPDNQLLVGGSDDGKIQVWDSGTGDLIYNFKGHEEAVQAVDFSTTRTELASAGINGRVFLWSLIGEGVRQNTTIQHNTDIYDLKFSPDGNILATGAADRLIRIWNKNAPNKNTPLKGHEDIVSNLDFSPDGTAIVSGSPDGRILFWDRIGERIRYKILGHTGGIKALTYTNDNRIRACGAGIDGKLRIWDAGTSSSLSILREHIGLTQAVTFSNDGKTIASGGSQDGTIFLSNVSKVLESRVEFNDDSLLKILTGNRHGITALAITPENKTIATGGDDGRIHIIDHESNKKLVELKGPQYRISALTFGLDSTRLFSGEENGTVRQWNSLTGEEIGDGFNGSFGAISALAYSTISKYLAVGDRNGKIQFYNPVTNNRKKMEFQTPHRSKVTVLIFSKDGNTLVSGSENGTIILWDMKRVNHSPEEVAKIAPKGRIHPINERINIPNKNELTATKIAKIARSATVNIITLNVNKDTIGQGSGFFISNNKIATNYHVVDGASSIYVRIVDKERLYRVESIVATDKPHDLAILKVTGITVPVLTLANSDSIEIGENVYAVGNPGGLEGTFSQGIISSIRGKNPNKWIQITAAISPGSSGGAVLNSKGEVIGIATSAHFNIDPKLKVNRSQNINFAVPSNYLKTLLSKVK